MVGIVEHLDTIVMILASEIQGTRIDSWLLKLIWVSNTPLNFNL